MTNTGTAHGLRRRRRPTPSRRAGPTPTAPRRSRSRAAPATPDPIVVGRAAALVEHRASCEPGQAVVVTFQATPTHRRGHDAGRGLDRAAGQHGGRRGRGCHRGDRQRQWLLQRRAGDRPDPDRLGRPDPVTKTHVDPTVAGGQATWTVTVTNAGPDTAVGPFVVTDTLPGRRHPSRRRPAPAGPAPPPG